VAARQTVAFMARAATSAEAAAELAQRQREAGALGARDLARQVAFSAETQTQLARARQTAVAEREKLLRQLGLAVATRLLLPDRLPDATQGNWNSANVESLALDQRLDIEAAKRDLDVAGQAAGITNLTRFVNIQAIGVAQERESGQAVKTGPVLELELPIFDWGSAKVARAQTLIRESGDRLVETVVRVRSEVRERIADVETMGDVLKRQQATILPMRERIVKETQLLYNGMLEGIYTLLNDYREGVLAGRDYIDAQRDYWIAIAQLERATGGRLPQRAESNALSSSRDARVQAPVAPPISVSQLPSDAVKGNTP
jgi:outer membrane protein TolC